jgi:CSLREA domain-containing protein
MKRMMGISSLAVVIGLIIAFGGAQPAAAANLIQVNTTSDVVANDGFCSLREAVIAANSNTPSGLLPGECAAGSATAVDEIALTGGQTYDLTLVGSNENNAQTGDLDILNNPHADVDVRIVALGDAKAIVRSVGLNDRIIEIHGATVEIENVTLRGGLIGDNGGGILNNGGALTLTNVTLRDNVAQVGGGLYNLNGTAVISNSAVEFNNGALGGGGIFNSGAEASLTVQGSALFLNQSSNGSGGGVYNSEGAALIAAGSEVSRNMAQQMGGGLLNSNGGQMIITGSSVGSNAAVNSVGGGVLVTDENSHLLIAGSELSGNGALHNSNGRGGGLMVQEGATAVVSKSEIVSNAAYAGGGVFVQEATLTFSDSVLAGNTAVVVGGLANINSATTLHTAYVHANIADESAGGIYNNSQLTLTLTTLEENIAAEAGGGIYNDNDEGTANLILNSVTLVKNEAEVGGGIFNAAGIILIDGSQLSENVAELGGGIHTVGGHITVQNNTEINSNEAAIAGGGILMLNGAEVSLAAAIVAGNQTAGEGAGVALGNDSHLLVHQTQFVANKSALQGGGIYIINNAQLTMTDSAMHSNEAEDGAAIYVEESSGLVTFNRVAFFTNIATNQGGAIWTAGPVNLFNSTVSGNTAVTAGGLYLATGANVDARHITVAENRPALFDLLKEEGATLEIRSSIIATQGSDNCFIVGSNIVSLGHNIANDNSCGGLTEASDQVNVDPLLAPLADNGGNTMTHALLVNSPAIGAADAALCAVAPINGVDQRGLARLKFNSCDIGAVEWQGFALHLPVIIR